MKPEIAEQFRQDLEKEYQKIQKSIEQFRTNNSTESLQNTLSELSSYDNHPADIGSETYEMEKGNALLIHQQNQLSLISKALHKISTGMYGICERCKNDIDPERLLVLPQATLCIICETMKPGKLNVRPVEEEALTSRFGNHTREDRKHEGENAWQDVANYNKTPNLSLDWYDNDFTDEELDT